MPLLSISDANKRLAVMFKGLQQLDACSPYPLPGKAFFPPGVKGGYRSRMLGRLIDEGVLERLKEGNEVVYRAGPKLAELIVSQEHLAGWLRHKTPKATLEEAVELVTETRAAAPSAGLFDKIQAPLVLPPPPVIENMQRPPEGSSDEVVKEWIFTLLHAQTENIIYMREKIDRAVEILEKLL